MWRGGGSSFNEPESGFQTALAEDCAGVQTQQDVRFRRLEAPSGILRHRTQAIVAGNPGLAADGREAALRVFQSQDTAGDARAVCFCLPGLGVGELVCVFDEAAAGTAAAD